MFKFPILFYYISDVRLLDSRIIVNRTEHNKAIQKPQNAHITIKEQVPRKRDREHPIEVFVFDEAEAGERGIFFSRCLLEADDSKWTDVPPFSARLGIRIPASACNRPGKPGLNPAKQSSTA